MRETVSFTLSSRIPIVDNRKLLSAARIDATRQSIETARKTLEKSERTADRAARHIQRAERVLLALRDAERDRRKR